MEGEGVVMAAPHTTRDHGPTREWWVELTHGVGTVTRVQVRAHTSRRAIVVAMRDIEDEVVVGEVECVRVWRKNGP